MSMLMSVFMLLSLWILSSYLIETPYISRIIFTFPWLSLISFGSFCLARIGWDLLTFNDFPEEVKVLERVRTRFFDNLFLLKYAFVSAGYRSCKNIPSWKRIQECLHLTRNRIHIIVQSMNFIWPAFLH